MTKPWHYADQLSDAIVDATNHTLLQMREHGKVEPLMLLAGHLMGFMALLKTLPPEIREAYPPSLVHLQEAVNEVRDDLARHYLAKQRGN
jgi:hypothetical protein